MNAQELINRAVSACKTAVCHSPEETVRWHHADFTGHLAYLRRDSVRCENSKQEQEECELAIHALNQCINAGLGHYRLITAEDLLDEQIDGMERLIQEQLDDASDSLSSRAKTSERLDALVTAHRLMSEVLTALL